MPLQTIYNQTIYKRRRTVKTGSSFTRIYLSALCVPPMYF